MTRFKPEGQYINTPENKGFLKNASTLKEAYKNGKILEGRVIQCDSAHNLLVELECMKGLIPKNEGAVGIEGGTVRDIALISRVSKPVCFVITGFEKTSNGEPLAILSRRQVQEACHSEYLSQLVPGDVIPVRVSHLEPFGVFVDIGCGISSLIPIDSISVSRISHPRDRLRVGQDILAVVKSIEDDGRINLTHKELLGTWDENARDFTVGSTVSGIIRSIEEYGIFVELTPNLAGLAELKEDVRVGQHASVYIKNMIPERMKVKLIIVDAFDEDAPPPPPRYFIGDTHIKHWVYSPPDSIKLIETCFGAELGVRG